MSQLWTLTFILIWSSMGSMALGQAIPVGVDSFEGTGLPAHWTVDAPKGSTATVDAGRGVLVLTGKDNTYNHVEAQLPAEASRVQVDLCNVNDVAASWSPSVILYWNESNYTRLMVSLHYSLRVDSVVDGQSTSAQGKVAVHAGVWYRIAAVMEADGVRWLVGAEGGEAREVCLLPRPASWQGAPRLILGKGYMPPTGGNPDFDNSYGKDTKQVRVELDNVVVGPVEGNEALLAASVARRDIQGEVDPGQLEVAFWPQITRQDTAGEVVVAPDVYQRLCLIYCNYDEQHPAKQLGFELQAPVAMGLQEVCFGPHAVDVARTVEGEVATYRVTPATDFTLPASFAGVPHGEESGRGWFKWPTSRLTPPLFLHCTPGAAANGQELRARALCVAGAGPWREVTVRVTEPLSELAPTAPEHLGISLWDGAAQPSGPQAETILDRWHATLARLGVKRIHTGGEAPVVAAARAHGIQPFLMSWWHYSTQCPPSFTPTDDEKCTNPGHSDSHFCPVVIAEGSGTYGQFLQTVTEKMAQSGCDGFMLDYECAMPLCYCERCKQAFIVHSGCADVDWPGDVKKDGRYLDQWISFRCQQGAMYVKAIRDAAHKARPGCAMQAWIAGYDYAGTIRSATIDISKASQFMTEPEVPHYTLPADYSDMWTADVGNGSVEMGIQTVSDSLGVVDRPIIFCSSVIYPLGSDTVWSDPQILDAQIQAIIAQGARGVSFWGGHLEGALDGRYLQKVVKWNNLLSDAGPFLWHGERQDELARVSDADKKVLRRTAWVHEGKCLLCLVNLGQEEREVDVSAEGYGTAGTELMSGRSVDMSKPVEVPGLNGLFVVVGR